MFACENGQKDVVQLFLDNSEGSIDFNAISNGGSSALLWTPRCCSITSGSAGFQLLKGL